MRLESKLLISHPRTPVNSFFSKSVIFLYQNRPNEGSIGVMTNKPSQYTLQDIFREKQINCKNMRQPIYHGGPVNTHSLILLHTNEWESKNTSQIGFDLAITSDEQMLHELAFGNRPKYWRLFGGFCGWAPGQLHAEMNSIPPYKIENSWLVADADINLIFDSTGEKQYNTALKLSSQQMFDQYF